MREEFGNLGLGRELDATRNRRSLGELFEVFLNRYVRAEMEVAFEFVAVEIPHAVEIAGGEPVGVEDLLRLRTTDGIEQKALKLVVGNAVFGTGTDIVVVLPELFRDIWTADALEESAGIFDGCPFQDAANGNMEHDRVVVLEDGGIEDAGLTE